jgi:hypothetical protein
MSWSSRKQIKYLFIFFLFIGFILFLFLYPIIFKKPTCFDGKLNGQETGVDCGGSCLIVCKEEISSPIVLWSRAFPVVGNNYNLVAFIENRNKSAGVYLASYEFRIYDDNNKLLGRREGKTFIPPNQQFAVFESRFDAGQSNLKSVTFEFLPPLTWVRKEPIQQKISVKVSNIVFDDNKDNPTLSAIINNDSIYDLPEFEVIAILYDQENNAINASKTKKDKLLNNSNSPVYFTWPEVLSSSPVKKDIFVLINPFLISF